MGNPLFGIDISKLINDNVGPGVLPVTLTKLTPGARTNVTGGQTQTPTVYTGRGFIDRQAKRNELGTLTQTGDVVIVLIGDSFAVVPAINDLVTIESTTYWIVNLDRDPAAAVYTVIARRR